MLFLLPGYSSSPCPATAAEYHTVHVSFTHCSCIHHFPSTCGSPINIHIASYFLILEQKYPPPLFICLYSDGFFFSIFSWKNSPGTTSIESPFFFVRIFWFASFFFQFLLMDFLNLKHVTSTVKWHLLVARTHILIRAYRFSFLQMLQKYINVSSNEMWFIQYENKEKAMPSIELQSNAMKSFNVRSFWAHFIPVQPPESLHRGGE